MYRTLRNTHLVLGLLSVPFLLIYLVSAVQMAHQLKIDREISADEFTMSPGLQPRPLALAVMERNGYNGELGVVKIEPEVTTLNIISAGARHQVFYNPKTGKVHLRSTTVGILGVLNRLHHSHGFGNESAASRIWSGVLACLSVILLLLGATGIYLWFRLHDERVAGARLLLFNLIVAGTLIAALRW